MASDPYFIFAFIVVPTSFDCNAIHHEEIFVLELSFGVICCRLTFDLSLRYVSDFEGVNFVCGSVCIESTKESDFIVWQFKWTNVKDGLWDFDVQDLPIILAFTEYFYLFSRYILILATLHESSEAV